MTFRVTAEGLTRLLHEANGCPIRGSSSLMRNECYRDGRGLVVSDVVFREFLLTNKTADELFRLILLGPQEWEPATSAATILARAAFGRGGSF